jgi:4-carboxymuconolactone decarboxylase
MAEMSTTKRAPGAYRSLKSQHAAYMDAVEALGSAVRQAGPLDERTTQLVQLGAAAAIRSEGAVHSHVRRALEAGASPEDIEHALIALTSTIGFPQVRAALSWAHDVLHRAAARKRKRPA